MRLTVIAAAAIAFFAVGCSSAPADDATVKEGSSVATNPGGKPRNEQEAAMSNTMSQAGNQMNAQRDADMKAMEEAKKKAGVR